MRNRVIFGAKIQNTSRRGRCTKQSKNVMDARLRLIAKRSNEQSKKLDLKRANLMVRRQKNSQTKLSHNSKHAAPSAYQASKRSKTLSKISCLIRNSKRPPKPTSSTAISTRNYAKSHQIHTSTSSTNISPNLIGKSRKIPTWATASRGLTPTFLPR